VLPGRRSLKSLPGVKTVFVAAIWTAVCVGLPVAAAHNGWGIRELLVAAVVFCLMSTIVSVNDLYDTRADRLNGIRSLAVLFGEGSVRVGGVAVSLAAALVAACSVGSPGLLLAALYHAAYAGSVRVDRGRDCWSNALVYRASSFVMLLLVVLVR
jgi:4-hydroxybenzoate polyprenyltransferase